MNYFILSYKKFFISHRSPLQWSQLEFARNSQKADGEYLGILGLDSKTSNFLFLVHSYFHLPLFPGKSMSSKSVYHSCWVNLRREHNRPSLMNSCVFRHVGGILMLHYKWSICWAQVLWTTFSLTSCPQCLTSWVSEILPPAFYILCSFFMDSSKLRLEEILKVI